MGPRPTSQELLRAMREKCMDCSGHSRREVHRCAIRDCPLWPYRERTEEKREGRLDGQICLFELEKSG